MSSANNFTLLPIRIYHHAANHLLVQRLVVLVDLVLKLRELLPVPPEGRLDLAEVVLEVLQPGDRVLSAEPQRDDLVEGQERALDIAPEVLFSGLEPGVVEDELFLDVDDVPDCESLAVLGHEALDHWFLPKLHLNVALDNLLGPINVIHGNPHGPRKQRPDEGDARGGGRVLGPHKREIREELAEFVEVDRGVLRGVEDKLGLIFDDFLDDSFLLEEGQDLLIEQLQHLGDITLC